MITPGVVAEFDRADYRRLAFAGRRFQVAQVPPNTVFHLALPRAQPPASGRADTRRRVNQRIDGRLQPLAGGQGRARSASRAGADPSGDATEAAMIFQRRQQAAVIRAIDRIVAAESGGGQAKPEP